MGDQLPIPGMEAFVEPAIKPHIFDALRTLADIVTDKVLSEQYANGDAPAEVTMLQVNTPAGTYDVVARKRQVAA